MKKTGQPDSRNRTGSSEEPPADSIAQVKLNLLGQFLFPSLAGIEMQAVDTLLKLLEAYPLSEAMLDRMKTAVAETVMNAIEHGNHFQAEIPVSLRLLASSTLIRIEVTDRGGFTQDAATEQPDLAAKLAGEQSPRGWGLFLIRNMVDELEVHTRGSEHTVSLIYYLAGPETGTDIGQE